MQPWGISGPAFLLCYVLAVLIGLGVADHARRWSNRTTLTELPSTVDFAEAAFVAGGTDRVVDTAVARLVHSEQFRVTRKGVLSAPGDPVADHPIDRDVHQALGHRSMKVYALRKRVRAMPEVQALAARITGGRRARSPRARALAKYASLALLCLVVAVGVARLVNGFANGLPVGFLFLLLVVSMAVIPAYYLVVWPLATGRPARGDPVLALARDQLAGVDLVAVSGLAAYPDEGLRATLRTSATPPKRKGAQQHEAQYSYGPPASSSDGGSGGGCGGGNPN
ncbi:TIGR04222 domain-containing membrane protein [Actinophytocola sediminis]